MIPIEYLDLTQSNPSLCVYAISGVDTGKVYFGKTDRDFETRSNEHFGKLAKGKHVTRHLQNFYNLHGSQSLVSFVVEKASTEQELDSAERKWIADYKGRGLCFNSLDGGSDGTRELGKRREKTWQLLDACGQLVTFKNYIRFCDSNSFSRGDIWRVIKGQTYSAHGYRNTSEAGKTYTLTTPTGQTVTTDNLITLAAQFPATSPNKLHGLTTGKRWEHNGFTNPARPQPPKNPPRVKLTAEQKAERYERQKEKERNEYQALSAEAKTIRNKGTWERRKSNADLMKRQRECNRRFRERHKEKLASYQRAYMERRRLRGIG